MKMIIPMIGIAVFLTGCATADRQSSLVLIDCRPRFETTQPYKGLNDTQTDLRETSLVLAASGESYRVLWFQNDGPPPVPLNTNQTYTFVIDHRPDWALSGYLHCPGGSVPAGFLREIREDGKTVWKDTFYKENGCY